MGKSLHEFQTTLAARVTLDGIGVHSGMPARITLNPAFADTGVVFQFDSGEEVRALASEVGATDLSTLLGNRAGKHVSTVEHLMAALYGLGVDNVFVEIDGNEVPILDGSAGAFVEAIDGVGIETLDVRRRYIRIIKPVRIDNGPAWAEFRPHEGTRFDVEIDFETPTIGRQRFSAEMSAETFRKDVSRARTFGFLRDVERLWAAGFALGSSLENTVAIGDDGRVINMEGLRFEDEFVRHKMLDAVGDLSLAGARFIGEFRSFRGGHKLNAMALRQLLSDRSAFEIVETHLGSRGHQAELIAVSAPVYAPWVL
jgi:UDP-3-O-[3-hydroxymyristoyl] N-acetylglucosamine deacetylase